MILVHPHPKEIKQRFPHRQDDIIAIEKYFGKEDDQEVINKNITEELKKL